MSDQEDFKEAVADIGLTEDLVRALTMQTHDLYLRGSYNTALMDSSIHGTGLFATETFNIGDFIMMARIDGKRTTAGRFTNHARRPNAIFVPRAGNAPRDIDVIAILPIKAGTEITVDYRQAFAANEELQEALKK